MLYSTSRDARWPQLVPGIISRSGRLQVAGREPMGGRRAHRGPDHWAGPGPALQRQPGLRGTVAAGRPPGPAACRDHGEASESRSFGEPGPGRKKGNG